MSSVKGTKFGINTLFLQSKKKSMADSFQIKGRLHRKFDTESKTETFQAREFVIVINEQAYPQFIKFQLTQDRCGLIDPVNEGNEINVHFDLRGREWNGKFFTNLNAWKVEIPQELPNETFDVTDPEPPVSWDADNIQAEDFDDLPF